MRLEAKAGLTSPLSVLPRELWKDFKSSTVPRAIQAEVPVEGEDFAHIQPLRQGDERGIGEVHGEVRVLPHQVMHSGKVVRPEVLKTEASTQHQLPQEAVPAKPAQEVHGLRDDGPSRQQPSAKTLQGFSTQRVRGFAGVVQS